MHHNSHHHFIKYLETEQHMTTLVSISEAHMMTGASILWLNSATSLIKAAGWKHSFDVTLTDTPPCSLIHVILWIALFPVFKIKFLLELIDSMLWYKTLSKCLKKGLLFCGILSFKHDWICFHQTPVHNMKKHQKMLECEGQSWRWPAQGDIAAPRLCFISRYNTVLSLLFLTNSHWKAIIELGWCEACKMWQTSTNSETS